MSREIIDIQNLPESRVGDRVKGFVEVEVEVVDVGVE